MISVQFRSPFGGWTSQESQVSRRAVVAFILASSTLVAPLPLIATAVGAVQCSDSTPEGMKRPGGFCDIRARTDTLAPPVASPPVAEAAPPVAPGGGCGALDMRKLLMHLPRGARILAAC
jgi:hypothetical protein